jgi:hypothetical protein
MSTPVAFLRWCNKTAAEDTVAAESIEEAIAALAPIRRLIAQREAARRAAAAEDRDSPWSPTDIDKKIDAALSAIYDLSEAYAEAYAADMPESPDAG